MKKHINIPLFIPHLGCPNTCVFCNQRTITGVSEFSPETARAEIETALSTVGADTEAEIAFFGGSFTGIDRSLMIELLEIAHSYLESGRVSSVRCSTRPDYIDSEILDILIKYGVGTVELGLQSADDTVLRLSKRGHDREAERRACELIVSRGLNLVGQMMIGLPGSTEDSEIETARFIIDSGTTAARIYPTVVFYGTELCEMAEAGLYEPLKTEDAVRRSARVLDILEGAGVDVIRIGLCASENLSSDDKYYAGPNHSALGELVIGELYYMKIKRLFEESGLENTKKIEVFVARGATSKAIGHKKRNKLRLMSELLLEEITFIESVDVSDCDVRLRGKE